jgi:glycolate oxidase FAD binding subunit
MSELAHQALIKEWCERVSHAAHGGTQLRLEGFASKGFWCDPTRLDSTAAGTPTLSTLALNGIIAYEPSELYIQGYCGTPLSVIEDLLDAQGQCLPFEPPRLATASHPGGAASLGGMVSSGLAGPARVSAGGVRDHVLGLGMINGLGEHLLFGGQVIKNVAGYDVSRLLSGSMGRLGLITEVSLKVLPKAASECSFSVNITAREASHLLAQWGSRPLALNASAWLQTQQTQTGLLMVRLRGAKAATQSSLAQMLKDIQNTGSSTPQVQVLGDEAQATSFWRQLRDQTLEFFSPSHGSAQDVHLWRVSLPPHLIAAFEDLPSELNGRSRLLEWHGALQWWWADSSDARSLDRWVQTHGGHMKLYRPLAGDQNTPSLQTHQTPLSPLQQSLEHRIQLSFDPKGVFAAPRHEV